MTYDDDDDDDSKTATFRGIVTLYVHLWWSWCDTIHSLRQKFATFLATAWNFDDKFYVFIIYLNTYKITKHFIIFNLFI